MSVLETLEGIGQLEKWVRPDKKYEVCYRFKIRTDITKGPGFPTFAGKADSEGTVGTIGGGQFPEGEYRLYTENEILKVQNIGTGRWCILSS